MGLDIYAGPLCRYYSGNWLTIVQQIGAAQGMEVVVVRPKERGLGAMLRRAAAAVGWKRAVDPVAAVSSWRDGLAAEGHFPGQSDWSWPESLELQYQTDKPNFDGLVAVQVWAAYAERPDVAVRQEFLRDWSDDPVFAQANESTKFDHIIIPELWLPVPFDATFEAAEPNGKVTKIGSVFSLWQQLRRLNQMTWKATDEEIHEWRKGDFDPEKLYSMARWGFSIWYCLTEFAVDKRLPMRLDY